MKKFLALLLLLPTLAFAGANGWDVTDMDSRVQYTASGCDTGDCSVYTVPFEWDADTDLQVYSNGTLQTLTTHYTLSGAQTTGGGSVTFVTEPTNGDVVTIWGAMPYDRTSDPTSYPTALNDDLDRQALQVRQLGSELSRVLRLPVTEDFSTVNNLVLPTPVDGKCLGWSGTDGTVTNEDCSSSTFTGVTSIGESGDTATGDVVLAEGANMTISRSGQTITLASSGGGTDGGTWGSVGDTVELRDGSHATFEAATLAKSEIGVTDEMGLVYAISAGTGGIDVTRCANVLNFGATGDGSTDDATAIIAAINYTYSKDRDSETPSCVYFPPRDNTTGYRSCSQIRIPAYTYLVGNGRGNAFLRACDSYDYTNATFNAFVVIGDYDRDESNAALSGSMFADKLCSVGAGDETFNVEITGHGFATNDTWTPAGLAASIDGVAAAEFNDIEFRVVKVDADNFTIEADSTATAGSVCGGGADAMTWTATDGQIAFNAGIIGMSVMGPEDNLDSDSVGIYTRRCQEQCGLERAAVTRWGKYALHIQDNTESNAKLTNNTAQNWWIRNSNFGLNASATIGDASDPPAAVYIQARNGDSRGFSGVTLGLKNGPLDTSPSAWASATEYDPGDRVESGGTDYACILAHTSDGTNTPPNATYWRTVGDGVTAGLRLDKVPEGFFSDINPENHTYGVLVEADSKNLTFTSLKGHSGVTDIIRIESGANNINVQTTNGGASTNAVTDLNADSGSQSFGSKAQYISGKFRHWGRLETVQQDYDLATATAFDLNGRSSYMKVKNTGGSTVTSISNAVIGERFRLHMADNNTTFDRTVWRILPDQDFQAISGDQLDCVMRTATIAHCLLTRNTDFSAASELNGSVSAGEMTLPTSHVDEVVRYTGTADIDSFTPLTVGKCWRLLFTNTAAANGVVDSATLNLAGAVDFAYTPDDMLTLCTDGTTVFEAARSVN